MNAAAVDGPGTNDTAGNGSGKNSAPARSLVLGAFLKPAGEYLAGWRHPDAPVDAGVNLPFVVGLVRKLEAAGFDALFLPDLVGVPDADPAVLSRVAVVNDAFEPTTLLGALATSTTRLGLIASVSSTYSSPAAVAQTFASLARLSGGRAGWNLVTSLNDAEARNFGLDSHLSHAERYARAEAFVDEVLALCAADELPGGKPIIAQAGSSGPGQALAARVADLVFTRALPLSQAISYANGLREAAEGFGRSPEAIRILPELATVVAPTRAEAEDRFAAIRDLLHPRVALGDLEYWLGGVDLTGFPLDGPLPETPPGNKSLGTRQEIYEQAMRDHLTIGDLAKQVAGGDGAIIGTAADVADHVEEFVAAGAADGFNVSFPYLPDTLDAFCELVIPELRRRGLLAAPRSRH
ncbi:LLM class flavin-dependent oxidoreductase [Plantibacter sp. YIM 135347]|uniref:LLM class flavin-dependent oxidoreductase n=1 Tax=Plantibacter sp. YIM 135347 TaxID=3423919 RepID=UPI003D347905